MEGKLNVTLKEMYTCVEQGGWSGMVELWGGYYSIVWEGGGGGLVYV